MHQPQQPNQRPQQRRLRPNEAALSQKAVEESSWDEGIIRDFVGNPEVQGTAWDIGSHTVLFFGTSQDAPQAREVVATCGKLWNWLGTPRPFTLILWWADVPRHITATEWPSRKSVNGGWTTQNSSVIHVYRREEWDRVFIHEMIHALGWDWTMPEKPLQCWGLSEDSYTVPALFEAWTELYAEWLWCIWYANEYMAWEQQRAWQDRQALQILARQGGRAWKENTSVFAYYVLKAALAPHIAQLLLFGNGATAEEREEVLCRLAAPALAALRRQATFVKPVAISLRMSHLPATPA